MINEASTDRVYHFTSIDKSYKIIKDGHFKLSPAFTSQAEYDKQKQLYYLSMTRSRLGSYHQSHSTGVMFALDGRKINHNYKTVPINYWSGSVKGADEMEDRIISDKPIIPIKNLITEITILVHKTNMNDVQSKIVYFLYVYAKKHRIPCFVYDDQKKFISNDSRYALDHNTIKTFNTTVSNKNGDVYIPELESFINIYYNDYSKLSEKDKKVYTEILKNPDMYYRLVNDIHQSKNHGSNHYVRVGKMIRQSKVGNFSELYNKVSNDISKQNKEREKALRLERYQNEYEKNKELYDHIADVLDGEESFNRYLLNDKDDVAIMQIDKAMRIMESLGMISERAKLVWFDEYGLTEDAYKNLFKLDF